MRGNFPVILDACVLVQACLRDTLLRLAQKGVFHARWSDDIIVETRRALERKLGKTTEQSAHLAQQLREYFPDAWIEGYADLIQAMKNDEKDRHVLAAAVRGGCKLIVTFNVRHFSRESTSLYETEVHSPDEFLIDLYRLEPARMIKTLHEQGNDLKPPRTFDEILATLAKACPNFVELIQAELSLDPDN